MEQRAQNDRKGPMGPGLIALLFVLALSLWQAGLLYWYYLGHARLPLWDMAGHGLQGYELAADLRSGHLLRFLGHLAAQDSWPFGFSLQLAPFLLAGSLVGASGFAAATLLSTVCYALIPLALLWAAREVEEGAAWIWAGTLAAALFVAGPSPRLYAILIMREEAGALLSLLAFCLYLRARRRGTLGAWRAAGLAALALFFIKYNYGFIWLLTVTVVEIVRLDQEGRRKVRAWLGGLLWPWRGVARPPWWRVVVAIYLAAMGVVFLRWGSVAGSVLYPGIVIAALVSIAMSWRRPDVLRGWWIGLQPAYRAALETVVIPLWAWNLLPDHTRSILAFVLGNRTSGLAPWSAASLLFYPRVLARDYLADPRTGMVLLLFIISSLAWWRRGGPLRVLQAAALLGFGLVAIHPHKQERFLAVVAPFLLLLGATAFARLAHAPWPAKWRAAVGGLICAAALAAVLAPLGGPRLPERLRTGYLQESMDRALEPCLDWLRARADRSLRTAVVGSFNEFSGNLIVWSLRQGPHPAQLPEVPLMDPPEGGSGAGPEIVREWAELRRPEQVLAIRLLPESPWYASGDFQRWNAWQLRVIDALEADPSWEVTARQRFQPPGLELMVLRRKG